MNVTDGCGTTAMDVAAFKGNLKMCKLLKRFGCNDKLKNDRCALD